MNIDTKSETKGSILLIDDLPENLKLLNESLSQLGYNIRSAISGSRGLKTAKLKPPDIVILDVKMPEMDGYEVCQAFKADPELRNIPILFISVLDETFDKLKAFQVGGVDYITKPFQTEEVIARIELQLTIQYQKKLLKQEIDRRKLAEIELRKSAEKLKKSNEELEIFSHRLVHDLRDPLSILQSIIYMLKQNEEINVNKLNKFFDLIQYSAKKMNNIIEGLSILANISNNQMMIEMVNLTLISQEIAKQLQQGQLHRQVNINIANDLIVKGDKQLLTIALENLINNAWKYTSKKENAEIDLGYIEITKTEQLEQLLPAYLDEEIKHAIKQLTPNIIYFVRDNGAGFNPEKAQHIFAPFQRLHGESEFQGTGLGLSTVHKIIMYHGGIIWYNAAINEGATFYFILNANLTSSHTIL